MGSYEKRHMRNVVVYVISFVESEENRHETKDKKA